MLIVFGSLDESVQKHVRVVVSWGQVALDVQSYTPDRDASEPAAGRSTLERMPDEVESSDPETVKAVRTRKGWRCETGRNRTTCHNRGHRKRQRTGPDRPDGE